MITNFRVWIFFSLIIFGGCKSQTVTHNSDSSTIPTICKPYFIYDNVEHYYIDISEGDELQLENKKKKTGSEKKLLDLLIQDSPYTLADTPVLKNIVEIGFIRKDLPTGKLQKIKDLFCERKIIEVLSLTCDAVYRDILIFKQQNNIVGTAKICFKCNQIVIAGTSGETEDFGQSGEFTELYNLLH